MRDFFRLHVGETYSAEQLVFVDESAFNRHTARRTMGWATTGTRARRRDFFVRGQRYVVLNSRKSFLILFFHSYSILPALSLDGILHLDIQDRSYNAELFENFIDGLLDNMNPFPARNSVVVMDNCSIHKSAGLRAMIEERFVLPIPPILLSN